MAFPGANLTVDQLLLALKLKLENEIEVNPPFDMASQRTNWESTWSNRVIESKHVTSLLLHRLNALPAVNGLPFEILGEIFLYVQRETSNTGALEILRRESDLPCDSTWMALTHVCRYWRLSAHNTKALWRHIIFRETQKLRANLATFFFKLSHPFPISVEHQIFAPISEREDEQLNEFYALLREHPDRILALYLRGRFPDAAWNLLQMSMPNVVEVELWFDKILVTLQDEDGLPTERSELQPMRNGQVQTFLGGQCASLRKLSLKNYTRPKTLFPALTHLYLTAEVYNQSLYPEDDFLDFLSSLSTTLEFLYLQQAGINLDDYSQSSYPIVAISERPVMRSLRWLEIHQNPLYEYDDFSLMLLYNLSLPSINTLVWDFAWSEDLTLNALARWGMSMVPPQELLGQVTCLVGCVAREKCFFLEGNTLYFDPDIVTFSDLEIWHILLPNLATLVLDAHGDEYDYRLEIRGLLKKFTTLKCLHLGAYSRATLLLSNLEKKGKDGSNSNFLPNLTSLTLYTGNRNMGVDETRNRASEWLVQRRLQPLELTADNSTTRARRHLRATYRLRYEMGSIERHAFQGQDI